jgi:hypothetical protein
MYKNQITYYFRSGAFEGTLALILLLLIPTDPKNNWFLGFSKTRLLSSVPLILLVLTFLLLTNLTLKRPELAKNLSQKLDSILEIYGFSLPVLLFLFGFMVVGPYFKTFTYLPVEEIKIRLLPFILYISSRFIQLVLVITVIIRTRSKRGIGWNLSRRNLTAILLTFTGILITAHLSISIISQLTQGSIRYREIWRLKKYFNVTRELNLPAYFSSLLLGFVGYKLCIIALIKFRRRANFIFQWFCLSILFFYLAIDELLALHELLGSIATNNIGEENLVFQDWAYAGIVLVALFIIFYWSFFNHLSPGHKLRFFVSAALYVGGFLGVEIIGSFYVMRNGIQEIPYLLFTTVEETLEMVGLIYFINTLMIYREEIKGKKRRHSV